jgi:ribosomal protein S18 acetylase RimI-like enzyme
LQLCESEKTTRLNRGETIPRNISQILEITRIRTSEHLLFNFYDFKYFNASENGSAMTFGNSKLLASLIVVPYILSCEAIFLRKRRCFAKLDNRVVGVLILHEKPESLYVSSLAVAPEYRRHGIAKQILNFSEKIAKKQGKRWLELTVLKKNSPARRFYEKSGFVNKKERRWSIVMQKEA